MPPIHHRFRPVLSSTLLMASLAVAIGLTVPASVLAHAELQTSSPGNGTSVAGPFAGPVILTYSEALQSGSHAELLDASGTKLADGAIDAGDRTKLTFALAAPLTAGSYTVQWTSVAADKDIARGTFSFTVAATAPTATPTAAPSVPSGPSGTALPPSTPLTGPPSVETPSAGPTVAAPAPSPGGDASTAASSAGDVLLPIVVGLLVVLLAAWWLLRRGRAAR